MCIRDRRKSRGVKQAGFVVLKETTMPSVLIETGYLTNQQEEAFLVTNSGQNKMANAIFEAFIEYKSEVEEHSVAPVLAATPTTKPISSKPANYLSKPTSKPTAKVTQKMSAPPAPIAIPTSLMVKEQPTKVKNNTARTAIPRPTPVTKPIPPKSAIVFKLSLIHI